MTRPVDEPITMTTNIRQIAQVIVTVLQTPDGQRECAEMLRLRGWGVIPPPSLRREERRG